MSKPTTKELYRAALSLAETGQPVFPCRASGGEKAKRPLVKWKDLASTDPAQIKAWWSQYRGAAIGIPTGVKWDVLDVDVKNGSDGTVHLQTLYTLGLLDGCKRVARTPSGGWHLYFKAAPNLNTNKANAALGLDVRAAGGYVIAPPSYVDVGEYEGSYTDEGATIDSTDDPLFWTLVEGALAPTDSKTKEPIALLPSERRGSTAALREWLSNRKPGERNPSLYWAVCRCIDNGIDPHEMIEAALFTGLSEDEILLTIGSALKRAGVKRSELVGEAESLFPTE